MKITKIQQQVKRSDRYSIYIDEKYSFSLSDYQLVSSGLHTGKEFTPEELDTFLQESNFGKAYERALNYVMIRPRSEREIHDYLTRTFLFPKPKVYTDKTGERHIKKQIVDKEKTSVMIQRVLERLSEKGYINDASFARSWVNSRQLTKKSSKRKLEQELRAKGVASDVVATVLSDQGELEIENLSELIAKKQRLIKYQDTAKLTQYLLRQGFNYDDIRSQIRETDSDT
jgi:regulatory protein